MYGVNRRFGSFISHMKEGYTPQSDMHIIIVTTTITTTIIIIIVIAVCALFI
jgi:hypothetical protein